MTPDPLSASWALRRRGRSCAPALAIPLALNLQGCSTFYQYDSTGNTTCVSYGLADSSTVRVAPPIITNTGATFGCPRRVVVSIADPDKANTIHYQWDDSTGSPDPFSRATSASPEYTGPISIIIQRSGQQLNVRAVAVNRCNAVSTMSTARFSCDTRPLTTPQISHWFDSPLPITREYNDVIYENAQLPAGCSVTDARAVLLDSLGRAGPATELGANPATDLSTGIDVTGSSGAGSGLEIRVHSWHHFGYSVRFDIEYTVSGTNCALPPFTHRPA